MFDLLACLPLIVTQGAAASFHHPAPDLLWVAPDLASVRAAWPETFWARLMQDREAFALMETLSGTELEGATYSEFVAAERAGLGELERFLPLLAGFDGAFISVQYDERALESLFEALRSGDARRGLEGAAAEIAGSFAFLGLELPGDQAALERATHVVSPAALIDAFGEPYLYERSADSDLGFRLTTLGADGERGGAGEDADLVSEGGASMGLNLEAALAGLDVRAVLRFESEAQAAQMLELVDFGDVPVPAEPGRFAELELGLDVRAGVGQVGSAVVWRIGSSEFGALPAEVEFPEPSGGEAFAALHATLAELEGSEPEVPMWWLEWNGELGQAMRAAARELLDSSWTPANLDRFDYEANLVEMEHDFGRWAPLRVPNVVASSLSAGKFEWRVAGQPLEDGRRFGLGDSPMDPGALAGLDATAALQVVVPLEPTLLTSNLMEMFKEGVETESASQREMQMTEDWLIDWFDRVEAGSGTAILEDVVENLGGWLALSVHTPSALAVPEHAIVLPLENAEETFDLLVEWLEAAADQPIDPEFDGFVRVRRREMEGRPGVMITPRGVPMVRPSLALDGDRLVLALNRDALRSFLAGLDEGRSAAAEVWWDGLPGVPLGGIKLEFEQLSQELLTLGRTASSAFAMFGELPFDPADLPAKLSVLEGVEPLLWVASVEDGIRLQRITGSFSLEVVLGGVASAAVLGVVSPALGAEAGGYGLGGLSDAELEELGY